MSQKTRKMDEMKQLEDKYADDIAKGIDGIKHVAIRELIKSVAMDSRKHAGFYAAISSLYKEETTALTEDDFKQLENMVKKHIETEAKMIKEVKELVKGEKNKNVNRLLNEIYSDEIRHHALLKSILEVVVKRETIFDEDVWNMLWKDVPTHGAPPEATPPP